MSLTSKDVAELLGTSIDGVHKLVKSGTIKAHRSGRGKRLVFDTWSVHMEYLRRAPRARNDRARSA